MSGTDKDYSDDRQKFIHGEVARIKRELAISGDLLTFEQLSQVLGKTPKALWNMRDRGQMPPIPSVRMGQREGYWIVNVVLWMSGNPCTPMPETDFRDAVVKLASDQAREVPSEGAKSRKREMTAAKRILLERGLKILEERRRNGQV